MKTLKINNLHELTLALQNKKIALNAINFYK